MSKFDDYSYGLILAGASAVAGVALRLWVLTTPLGVMDADEAVVGLMAHDWLAGRGTIFYWGQNYGGSHESLLTAAVFTVVRSVPTAAKVVPAALHGLAAVLVWRIGARTLDRRAAVVAACLFWVWPAAFVWWSIKARGQYGSTLVLGLTAVLLALQLADDDLSPLRRRVVATGLGLAAGLGWWASFHVVFLVGPAVAWLVARRGRTAVGDLAWSVPGVTAGALPWLAWNMTHAFGSLRRPPVVAAAPPYGGRIEAFVTDAFPKATGATVPFSGEWAAPVAGPLVLGAVVAALGLVALALGRRRDTPDARDVRSRLALLVVIVVAYPFLFAASPFFYVDEPRYLYFLAPVLALVVARAVGAAGVPRVVPVIVLVAATGLSATTLATMARDQMGLFATGGVPVPRRLDPLVDALEDRGIAHVIAPYAMAYRITLDSGGGVTATPIEHARNARLNDAVRTADRPAWVFMAGSDLVATFETAAADRRVKAGCGTAGEFVICRPDARLVQEDLPELQP